MKFKGAALGILLLLAPMFFIGLHGQNGIVKGVVLDGQGNPIPDAKVTIQGMDVNRKYTLKTNDKGEFIHIGVNLQGTYRLVAEKEGYQGAFVEGIRPSMDRGAEGTTLTMQEGQARQMRFEMTDEEIKKMQEEAKKKRERSEELRKAFQGGLDAYNTGDYETALENFQKASELAPDEANVWGNMGQTHAKLGNNEQAVAAYEKAISISPSEAAFYQNLGALYSKMGEEAKAKAQYEKAAEMAATTNPAAAADSYYNMAVGYINSGKNAEAAEALEKALEFNPNHAEAHYQLGIVYLGLNKLEDCKEHLKQYLELSPNGQNAQTARELIKSL